MVRKILFLLLSIALLPLSAMAQIKGMVVDADDGYGVPYANVFIPESHENIMCDGEGRFIIKRRHVASIVVSSVGYDKLTLSIPRGQDSITVKLHGANNNLAEVKIKARRRRYSRKNNPAVELMRRVIARKKETVLENRPYYSEVRYQKITLSENAVDTVKKKRKPWFIAQLEKSPFDTTKLILPIMVNEQLTKHYYRRDPKSHLTRLWPHVVLVSTKSFKQGKY